MKIKTNQQKIKIKKPLDAFLERIKKDGVKTSTGRYNEIHATRDACTGKGRGGKIYPKGTKDTMLILNKRAGSPSGHIENESSQNNIVTSKQVPSVVNDH